MAKPLPAGSFEVRHPRSEQEWADYYDLRWQILRAPWQQPRGSEKDELEQKAWHLAAFNQEGTLIGAGRLHKLDDQRGQIRYMAIHPAFQSQGAGNRILDGLESQARTEGLKQILLSAREGSVGFYQKQGYHVVGKGHILFGSIQHFQMEKDL